MVVIKNFEMPEDCDSCPFYDYHNDYVNDCGITGEEVQNVKPGERHPLCPLVDAALDYRNVDTGAFQSGFNHALDEIKEQLEETANGKG